MINEFAFVVPKEDQADSGRVLAFVTGEALKKFGEGTKVLGFTKARSGTIRHLKKRGMPVAKRGGHFYIPNGGRIVWAEVDVPMDYIIKANGGTPGDVDLSALGDVQTAGDLA